MSEGGEDWGPPSPKQRRLDPACQLQKETEAAQALAEMTAWGGGSFEAVDQQEAQGSSAAKSRSLETAGQQGARGTSPAVGERGASAGRALVGARYGRAKGDGEASSDGEDQGSAAAGVEPARPKRRNAEAAVGPSDDYEGGRETKRKRKDARERRRAAEVAAEAAEDECSVISVGEEEEDDDDDDEEEEEGDEEEGGKQQPARKTEQYLEALEAVQLELEAVNQQANRAFAQLKAKFSHMRRPHLERRNVIIQNIPGFWVTAVSWHLALAAGKGLLEMRGERSAIQHCKGREEHFEAPLC